MGLAPGIHIGASLHTVPERDGDDDNREGEEEEDDEGNNDEAQGETPKDEEDGGRMMMRMMPNSSTLTPSFPNIGLGDSRLNKTNRSPPW